MSACPSCGARNADEARFCASCGAELGAACSVCGAAAPEGARFCPACGTQLEETRVGEERKLVTILFADVTGSTTLGEQLDPERLREVMDAYFGAMREEIEAEGGTVEKFIGDAVMAAFGVPTAHEDDPVRALRAATRMQERLERVNEQLAADHGVTLQIRIGVNTGEVLATPAPKPGEAMVTGDAVNVAARLEASAEPGGIVVSERTARAVRGFRFEDLGALDLKGKREPVNALRLVAGTPVEPERGVPGLQAPMVGRDQELLFLQTVFGRVATEGRPNLVTIYGEPGVGKSRLTKEFLAWAERQDRQPTIVRGRCLPYGEGVTYWPLAEILSSIAGVLDTDAPASALEKVREVVARRMGEGLATDPAASAAALAYTMGVEDPSHPFTDVEPRQVRAEIHAAWRYFFSALSSQTPVIAAIEDIHWADPALLDLLQELAERVQGPVHFVCPSRPDLPARRPGWGGGHRNFSSVGVEPLDDREADRLVSLLLAVEELPKAVHDRILERAEGNPFFLEEIVRNLIDEGLIVRSGDRWRAVEGIADVEIPDTVQGVLAARIDLLDLPEKRTLQSAAVVGRVFWPGPVEHLLNGEAGELAEILGRLEARELVLERLGSTISGEPEFIFKHVLTRDVAYESLPRRDRARAHAAVAGWIEARTGERRGEFAQLLAHHYDEAYRGERDDVRGDPDRVRELRAKAFTALLEASEEARRRFAIQNAAGLAERALERASGPRERAEALEQRGMIALNDYRGDLAWDRLKEAVDLRLEHVPEDDRSIARVCARAVEVPTRWPGSMTGIPPEQEVTRYLELGLARAGGEESEERVRLMISQAFLPFSVAFDRRVSSDEADEARDLGLRAAEIALGLGRIDLASAALDGASSVAVSLGRYGEALPIVARRLDLVDGLNDPVEVGDIYAMAAWGSTLIGDYPEAIAVAREGVSRIGSEHFGLAIHGLSWWGMSEFALGNWSVVIDELFPRVIELLGDRRDEPPYFAMPIFGAATLIRQAQGSDAVADRQIAVLAALHDLAGAAHSEVLQAWLSWIYLRAGRPDLIAPHLGRILEGADQAARPFGDQVSAIALAELGRWGEVPGFLERSRNYATDAGLDALPVHLDRLEGRALLTAGDATGAVASLERAREGFGRLGAIWERACTKLSLAEALIAAGLPVEARRELDGAIPVFEELRSLREIDRSREILAKL